MHPIPCVECWIVATCFKSTKYISYKCFFSAAIKLNRYNKFLAGTFNWDSKYQSFPSLFILIELFPLILNGVEWHIWCHFRSLVSLNASYSMRRMLNCSFYFMHGMWNGSYSFKDYQMLLISMLVFFPSRNF